MLPPMTGPAADNRGTDFWLGFPGNHDLSSSLSLFITGDQNTSGSVVIPGLNFSYQFQLQAGQLIRVNLPRNAQTNASDRVEYLGVHVTTQQEVTVYALNQLQYSTDAYLALPKDILGREYISLSYPVTTWGGFFLGGSRFMVVASENNTRLTITPSVTVGPRPAGSPYSITLNQGQTYQLSVATVVGADLSGSIISADKPIAVFGAHECTSVPNTYPACDHIVEQLFPTTAWGRNFVSMPLATRTRGDTFRMLASENNTSVYVNGTRVAVLNRGNLHERIISGPANITADHPILVAQYSNSSDYDNVTSDPFMMLLPPYEQFLTSYRVATPSSGISRNFINVVAPAAAVGSIRINGTVIPSSSFVTIGSTGYKGASVSIALGTHTLTGSMPFGVTVYGFDNYDSYGYPGGLSLSPVATVTSITLNPTNATATIGTDHCMTARVRDQNNNPVAGVRVDFAVTGVHNVTGNAYTNSAGEAGFCYHGTVVGHDTIRATIGTLSTTASVTWIQPTPTNTPTPTPTATATPLPTATPPLATPTATPDFPVCSVTLEKIAYPSTTNINDQVGVTLRLTGDCPGEIGAAVDVALVFDRSQSMCGAKLDEAQAAGQNFLDSMALPPDQASVISFAGTGTLHQGLTTNRNQATNALYNITCGGTSRL
ncbi:MAG: Ig-like domain-containing protein, partial [Anaerolineae bacterium]|nr:Ig-like domain-containing protein [Anaerolineae bacterium]